MADRRALLWQACVASLAPPAQTAGLPVIRRTLAVMEAEGSVNHDYFFFPLLTFPVHPTPTRPSCWYHRETVMAVGGDGG